MWRPFGSAACFGLTQQQPECDVALTICLRTDVAGDDINVEDQCFWIVAAAATDSLLLFPDAADLKEKLCPGTTGKPRGSSFVSR